jgi:hypothetical protein
MSTHVPSKQYPPRIYQRRFARNGHPVSAVLMRRLGDALMHDVAWRGQKVVLQYTMDWNNVGATNLSGTNSRWRARFRAPYGAERLRCKVALMPGGDYAGGAHVDPRVDMTVTIAGGATTTSNALHYAASSGAAPNDTPDNAYWGFIPSVAITPNTTYELVVRSIDYARPVACMVWTDPQPPMDDSDTVVVDPSPYSVSMPITDTQHSDLLVAGNNLWDRCASQLWSYTSDRSTASFSTSSTTQTHILDGASTSFNARQPGWYTDLRYRNRQAVSTVPVVFAVYAERTAGAGTGTCRFQDGVTTVDIANITTAGWYTTTANLPATRTKWDAFGFVSVGTTTVRFDAISVYQER